MTAMLLALWILFRPVLVPARTGRATTRPGKSVASAARGRPLTGAYSKVSYSWIARAA